MQINNICEIAKDFGREKETVRVALKKLGYTRKKQTKYRKQDGKK